MFTSGLVVLSLAGKGYFCAGIKLNGIVMKQNTKDWIQYTSAMLLIASAVAMAFISFFMTLEIGAGPLTYIGEALSAALGLFGISVYVVNRFGQLRNEIHSEMERLRREEHRAPGGRKEVADETE